MKVIDQVPNDLRESTYERLASCHQIISGIEFGLSVRLDADILDVPCAWKARRGNDVIAYKDRLRIPSLAKASIINGAR